MKTHYEKAADEIINAVKRIFITDIMILNRIDYRKAKKLIIQMLKTNFISRKSK